MTKRTRTRRGEAALVLGLVLGALLFGATPALAGGIYHFIDDRGVFHFSDQPFDERYRPVERHEGGKGFVLTPNHKPRVPRDYSFDRLILQAARLHDVEPELVKAVIAAESNFKIDAVSRTGAKGLMQLMPETADSLGVRQPFKAQENVRGGVRYLRRMLDRYGDVARALAAYNAGPKAVDAYGGIPPFPETKAYVKRVLTYYRGYRGEFPR